MKNPSSIKVAIHHRLGSFSDRWIEYCEEKGISYGIVNCYQSDIVEQLKAFDSLLWHWHFADTKALLFVRQLLLSVENMGIKVFPDIPTCWHYDDKVGQKYLLESVDAPLVPSYTFYEKEKAISWISKTEFPKVFKLRGGAGSVNVRLIKTKSAAERICKKAFGKGFKPNAGYFADISTRTKKARRSKDYFGKLKRMPPAIINVYHENKSRGREKGYVYFQDFIDNNAYDTRITVIGNRAFGFRRLVRKNDFRASGSGGIDYDISKINPKCIEIAFEVAGRLRSQSMAFDFVEDSNGNPLIVEVSYCYLASAVKECSGHWDRDMRWHAGQMWPQDAILVDLIESAKRS